MDVPQQPPDLLSTSPPPVTCRRRLSRPPRGQVGRAGSVSGIVRPVMRMMGVLVVLLLSMGLPGCNTGQTSDRSLQFIDVSEMQDLLAGERELLQLTERTVVLVDPRTERAFREGHLPGAINVPFQHVRDQHDRLREYSTIVVYGDDYNDPKAEGMSKTLIELGHDDVQTLDGGIRAWTAAGYELETGEG